MNEYGVRAKNQWISVENENSEDVNGEEVDTLWYYFGDNGKAYKATAEDGDDKRKKTCPDATGFRTYFFDSNVRMLSGWVEKEGELYYCGTENEGWAYTSSLLVKHVRQQQEKQSIGIPREDTIHLMSMVL